MVGSLRDPDAVLGHAGAVERVALPPRSIFGCSIIVTDGRGARWTIPHEHDPSVEVGRRAVDRDDVIDLLVPGLGR